MKTILIIVTCIFLLFLLNSCESAGFKKTPGGMPYKHFTDKKGKEIKYSKHFKVSLTQKLNDSVYYSTEGKMPLYFAFAERIKRYDLTELWTIGRNGDSMVSVQLLDTFMKKVPELAEKYKKDDRLVSYIKILDVFDSDSARFADEEKERNNLLTSETTFIEKYLAEKNIKAKRSPGGAFVEIIDPGKGNLIDTGSYVSFQYRGSTFTGTIFESNMDSSFGHTDPLSFEVGVNGMIKGFEEGMLYLRKDAIARFYIPSMLAYGAQSGNEKIKPFESLIFDIKIVDVKDKAPQQNTQEFSPHGN